jgi:hypothetical protein
MSDKREISIKKVFKALLLIILMPLIWYNEKAAPKINNYLNKKLL